MDNVSFKGAEIADIMGLKEELEKYEREHGKGAGENTLNFSFNKESSLQGIPDFGGGTINTQEKSSTSPDKKQSIKNAIDKRRSKGILEKREEAKNLGDILDEVDKQVSPDKTKKRKTKKSKIEGDILDLPSSTKKLKDMKALIDDQLSPIKPDPLEDHGDFKLKVQPVAGGGAR